MIILHYFLGFPPYRTGGLTKYSFDLMTSQYEKGDTVAALWPGVMRFFSRRVSVKRRKSKHGILNFELINPLPVSLDEGIKEIDKFMEACDQEVFVKFLKELKPDVIHIHTLMGLYKEFVLAATSLDIKIIFTTHDYFGICPKVKLCTRGGACGDDEGCKKCIACNQSALSIKKIKLLQSPLYRKIKNTRLIKKLRKGHRNAFFEANSYETADESVIVDYDLAEKYKQLRKYYIDILNCIDVVHFNSSVTADIYKKFLNPKNSEIISITHKNIADNRGNIISKSSCLRLTYLGPASAEKGFNLIKQALDGLYNDGYDSFKLKLFTKIQNPSPYMEIKEDGYSYGDLSEIFADTDLLLAPSVWYETFGFTVLEALSFGVPVIISENVGAKDIIGGGGIVIAPTVGALQQAIYDITSDKLDELRGNIQRLDIKTWDKFLLENYKLYTC